MSRNDLSASLKGKHGLLRYALADGAFQHTRWRKVNLHPEHIGKPIFKPYPIKQRVFPPGIEFGYEIDIRLVANSRAAGVGAVQKQVLDASRPEFSLVFA
jgi:hypothetical protein